MEWLLVPDGLVWVFQKLLIFWCRKVQIISDWFLEHDKEITLLKWPPQSPDLNPIEHLWDVVEREIHIMDVQPTNLQQLRDAIMSKWTKISEECYQHLVKSLPRRITAVLKAKVGPTQYWQGVPNKVASECKCTFVVAFFLLSQLKTWILANDFLV